MCKAIKLSVTSKIDTILKCMDLMLLLGIFGFIVGCLPWYIGGVMLAEISDIDIPLWTILVFVMVPATELYIYSKTDLIDEETFLHVNVIVWALWIASLFTIGYIENNLKLGLSGFEAFILSLGMPVGLVMIIAFIAFIVICVNKIATRHIDR